MPSSTQTISSPYSQIGDRRSRDRCPLASADLRVYWRPWILKSSGHVLLEKAGLVGQSVTLSEGLGRAPPKNESINAIDKGAYTHQAVACCDVSLQATRNMRASARTSGTVAKYQNHVPAIPGYSQSLVDWCRADGRFMVYKLNREMLRR